MSPKSSGTWGRSKLKACLVFLVTPCFREEGEGEKGTGREEGATVKLVNVGVKYATVLGCSAIAELMNTHRNAWYARHLEKGTDQHGCLQMFTILESRCS